MQLRVDKAVYGAVDNEQVFGAEQVPLRDGLLHSQVEPRMQNIRRTHPADSQPVR